MSSTSYNSSLGGTSISGVASGIDWQNTIQLLMQIESQPMVALETRKYQQQDKLTAWQTINSKLLALHTAMENMDTLNEVLTKAATSSNTDLVTATADNTAITGSYTILVNQLAQCAKSTHDGWADANATAVSTNGGTFTYSYAGVDHTVNVEAGATLTDLAQTINGDVDNPGVQATILNDGSGLSTAYHLVLSGETGAAHTITVADIGGFTGGLDGFTGAFTTTQTAANAQIQVDGYPLPGTWIESETNDVSGVIAGITLHLKDTSASTAEVTISNDTQAATSLVNGFVDAYNGVIAAINLNTAYDSEAKTAGILFGDASVVGIKGQLQSIVASVIPGLAADARYTSLSEIGVKSGDGGMLSVDSTKLNTALNDNFEAVGDIFAFSSSSTNNSLSYFTRTESTAGGIYSVQANYDASGNLLDTSTINGHPAQVVGNLTEGQYLVGLDGYPEQGLRIKFVNPSGGSAGSVTAEVRLSMGSAVQIGNQTSFLTDPSDGMVANAEKGIQDTIDNIDSQIQTWERRLQTKEAQLTQQFLAMETMISQLNNQGSYVNAMLSQL
jgi:flagellar hook-associated protein 2